MKYNYRTLAYNSICEFLQSNEKVREEQLYHVKLMLIYHYDSMKSISTGFADRYVKAGELFIRWVKIKGLDIITSNPTLQPDTNMYRDRPNRPR